MARKDVIDHALKKAKELEKETIVSMRELEERDEEFLSENEEMKKSMR